MTRYMLTVLLAALGCFLVAGGAVLLWLTPGAQAAGVAVTGALCYCGAAVLVRSRL